MTKNLLQSIFRHNLLKLEVISLLFLFGCYHVIKIMKNILLLIWKAYSLLTYYWNYGVNSCISFIWGLVMKKYLRWNVNRFEWTNLIRKQKVVCGQSKQLVWSLYFRARTKKCSLFEWANLWGLSTEFCNNKVWNINRYERPQWDDDELNVTKQCWLWKGTNKVTFLFS